jgi:hypothetical protein
MYTLMSYCFRRRTRGSFGLPMSRKTMTPRYGMRKMASNQAIPAVGRRLRGTTMTAMTRMMKSRTRAVMPSQFQENSIVMSPIRSGAEAPAY